MPVAVQLTDPDADHGEGPVWWPGWGGLCWVDMLAGDVLHLDQDTGAVRRWHVDTVAAIIRPRAEGAEGLVVVGERRLATAERWGGPLTPLGPDPVFDDPGVRFNEGACDPSGRLLAGTMAYDETPGAGAVRRFGADGSVELLLDSVTVSNGLCWTAGGDLAYYVDSATRRVDVFDSDPAGNISGRRPFATVEIPGAAPDGLTVDSTGGVWVALYDGGAVHHYLPDGTLAEVIDVAAAKVTACTLGGPDLDQLFITTSRHDADGSQPAAGALFTHQAGVIGLLPRTFAG